MQETFIAQLWIWDARKSDSWTFATVPSEQSDDLHERSGPRRGFGSLPVEVTIGASTWRIRLPRQAVRLLRPADQVRCPQGRGDLRW